MIRSQVPSAIRELRRFIQSMLMYSSMLVLLVAWSEIVIFLPRPLWLALYLTKSTTAKSIAGSRLPIGVGTQMRAFFHLQNHRRKILLGPFVRLPCINLKGSSRRGHSRANGSREVEN